MKDHVTALVEALRLARLELASYRDPVSAESADWTVIRLSELLESKSVTEALASLSPNEDSPSIVPESEKFAVPYPWRVHH